MEFLVFSSMVLVHILFLVYLLVPVVLLLLLCRFFITLRLFWVRLYKFGIYGEGAYHLFTFASMAAVFILSFAPSVDSLCRDKFRPGKTLRDIGIVMTALGVLYAGCWIYTGGLDRIPVETRKLQCHPPAFAQHFTFPWGVNVGIIENYTVSHFKKFKDGFAVGFVDTSQNNVVIDTSNFADIYHKSTSNRMDNDFEAALKYYAEPISINYLLFQKALPFSRTIFVYSTDDFDFIQEDISSDIGRIISATSYFKGSNLVRLMYFPGSGPALDQQIFDRWACSMTYIHDYLPNPPADVSSSLTLYDAGQYSMALLHLGRAGFHDWKNAELHYQMGKNFHALGKHGSAKDHLELSLRYDSKQLLAIALLAEVKKAYLGP